MEESENGIALHPLERRMARHWIKRRLTLVFPELRDDPRAIEEAYQALSLEARVGSLPEDAETVYEITHHLLR